MKHNKSTSSRCLHPAGSASPGERRIRTALRRKGYTAGKVTWEPIRKGGIMCGPEGGWYVEILRPRPASVSADLLAYSCGECLLKIEELPRQNVPDEIPQGRSERG